MSQYINEAFKKFRLLEDFEEFPLNPEGLDNLGSFMSQALDDETVDVYDLEAEAQEDLKKSYVGKVICDCNVCHSNIFYNKEDIVINDDGVVNAEDECPYCMSTDGYTIIGEIKDWSPEVEDEIEDASSDEELADEPIEIEDEEETEVVKESLKGKSRKRKLTESKKRKLNESVPIANEFTVAHIQWPDFRDDLIIWEDTDGEYWWVDADGVSEQPFPDIEDAVEDYKFQTGKEYESLQFLPEYSYLIDDYDDKDDLANEEDEEDFDESLKLDGVKSLRGVKGLKKRPEKAGVKAIRGIGDSKISGTTLEEGMSGPGLDRFLQLDENDHDILVELIQWLPDETLNDFVDYYDEAPKLNESIEDDDIQFDPTTNKVTRKSWVKQLSNGRWLGTGSQGHKVFATKEEAEKYSQSMNESIEDVTINTEDETMTMTTKEDGGVVVETSPKQEDEFYDDFDMDSDVEVGDEVIAPISDETEDEIMGNSEEEIPEEESSDEGIFAEEPTEEESTEEAPEEEPEEDIEVSDFDEETFDGLGESYLRRCYDNVNGYKTTQVRANNNTLIVEGVISFKSGAKKKTNFVFESKDMKNGKYIFEGYNAQINNGKPAFRLNCSIKNKEIIPTSFKYNYTSKNALNESVKLAGTVKAKRK